MVGAAFGALSTTADPDIWGHTRFGLDILANGFTSAPDLYSFTADRPFVYHEWLGGVVMALAFRAGGPAGLLALKAALAIAPVIGTWWLLRRAEFSWRWAGVGLAAWGALAITFTLRPQLWTLNALLGLTAIVTRGSRRALWLLPPMFALWANLHGGWIVGGGVLALWTAVAWLERDESRWHLLAVGVACLGSTLLNPYGLELWQFLLETVRLGRDDISEWSPIWRSAIGFGAMWAVTIGCIAYSWRRNGRPPLAPLVTLLFFAVAAARVNRLVPLFALAAVALLSRQWPRINGRADGSAEGAPYVDRGRAMFDAACVAAFVVAALFTGTVRPCIELDFRAPDTLVAESLRGTRGRLVTQFNWGEYALWHFGPGLKVSIDGRRETLYSMQLLEEQNAIAEGKPDGLAALARIRPEYVWLSARSSAARGWLRENGYREDVSSDRSFIAVRNDLPSLTAFTGQSSGCFPGP